MELNHAENRGVNTADKQCGGGVIIIYNYFTVKLREFYQGFPRPILPTKHQECSEGCFVGKVGRENPWLSKISNLPEF